MEIGSFIGISVLAVSLGIVLGRYAWPAVYGISPDVLATAQGEIARLDLQNIALRQRTDHLDADLKVTAAAAKQSVPVCTATCRCAPQAPSRTMRVRYPGSRHCCCRAGYEVPRRPRAAWVHLVTTSRGP